MKTFRLCSLTVFIDADNHAEKHCIPLDDGLIINKENKDDIWLIEGLIKKDFFQFFNNLKAKNEPMIVEAVITNKDNPPATFAARVRDIKFLPDQLQLLLDGKRLIRKDTFSEIILKDLIEKGISGEELLKDFKRIKKDRGDEFQVMVENDIREIKEKNSIF